MLTMKLIATLCVALNNVPLCHEELISTRPLDASNNEAITQQMFCRSYADGDIASFIKNRPEYKRKFVLVKGVRCGTNISLNPKGRV